MKLWGALSLLTRKWLHRHRPPDAIGQKLVFLETDPRGLLELLFLVFTWRYLLNFFKASNMTRWFIKTLLHEIHCHCEQLIVINQHEFSIIDSHAWICSYCCLHCMSMKLEKYHLRNGAQCCICIHLSSVSNEISSIVSFSVCWILICVIVCLQIAKHPDACWQF